MEAIIEARLNEQENSKAGMGYIIVLLFYSSNIYFMILANLEASEDQMQLWMICSISGYLLDLTVIECLRVLF
jgi:hypothetical protein